MPTKALYEYKMHHSEHWTDNLNIEITENKIYLEYYDGFYRNWSHITFPIQIWNSIVNSYNKKTNALIKTWKIENKLIKGYDEIHD